MNIFKPKGKPLVIETFEQYSAKLTARNWDRAKREFRLAEFKAGRKA
jgi:hypothetical protein